MRYAVLLRGINIGGNRIPMARLREILTGLGYQDVKTILASGQAVLTTDTGAAEVAAEVTRALAGEAGLRTDVIVRSGPELAEVVATCPFPGAAEAGARHAVVFLREGATPAQLASLEAGDWGGDEFAVRGTEIYLHLPDGFARSKLSLAVGRVKGVPATTRNWNTVLKLRDLTA